MVFCRYWRYPYGQHELGDASREAGKANLVSTTLEHWAGMVESLEKCGGACRFKLPFRVTALRVIVSHASDWFDNKQRECYKTLDDLAPEACHNMYQQCEVWEREMRFGADANVVNQDIGGVDGGEGGSYDEEGYYHDRGYWWNTDCDCWPAESNGNGDTNGVNKGSGRKKVSDP